MSKLGISHFDWVKIIKEDPDLSANAKYIAFYLSTFMNRDRQAAWPSLVRMVYETNLSKPTILKYVKELEQKKYLIKTKYPTITNGGSQNFNLYEADIPPEIVHEFARKVVNQINPPDPKGVKLTGQGGKADTSKGVKEVYPNKQYKYTKNKGANFKEVKKQPHWNDEQGWIELGEELGKPPRPGENSGQFKNRIKSVLDGVS